MAMSYQRARSSEIDEHSKNFKISLQALSNAVVSIVQLLSHPPETVTASALGTRLAQLLMCLRQHRTHALALASGMQETTQLTLYLDNLRKLRGSVAQWLTIHAAQPKLIFVELADFEAQCWSTLGMGVVLFDYTEHEDFSVDSALSSRFHQWWDNLNTRPAGLSS
ncbi:hypothetical protein [Variovorax sp. PCZ-1]|uniref:hypothetical protein n=1 Tax=Variovorax sp. PCZ-1 TaxID=2835533 RepID=UPI001BCDFA9E|nr:hypothetical protein [Variovorax sp. PCZ-1]MBS7807538.1 hypothetical protein [Variovorax sp. PCZ-1]